MTLAQKLEFDKLLEYAKRLTISDLGKSKLDDAFPVLSFEALDLELRKTSELKALLDAGEELPIMTLPDTREMTKKLAIYDAFLAGKELLKMGIMLQVSALLKKFIFTRNEFYPNLNLLTENLWLEKSLQYEIHQTVDDFGEVKSSASPALRDIRQTLQEKRQLLRRKLESLQRKYAAEKMLMEDDITIREGRLVLGFRVEHKYQVQGFIHDVSQSGQTVFIEPAETLQINNDIRENEIKEAREVERILREVASKLRKELQNIQNNEEILSQFDALYAKARLAREMNAQMPRLVRETQLKIISGYHPWLLLQHKKQNKTVVPLSMELGANGEASVLVFTGPNAGGKSVAMKTAGLLAYMLQFGFLLPCDADSVFPIFSGIFAEIGDEQSIDNDLSTFSSHLRNLKSILDEADMNSLVLIDEICSGTDPEEGSAIATAILESLLQRHAITIVTTHQGTLKAYAHNRMSVMNGSMQFDAAELRPTYSFRMGLPGSSFALEMVRRLDFAPHLVENAKRFMGENKNALENLIADLSARVQAVETERADLIREKEDAERLTANLNTKLKALDREKKDLRRKSLEDVKRTLAEANSRIEQAVREIKEQQASGDVIKAARQSVAELRQEIQAESGSLAAEIEATQDRTLREGDKVKLLDTNAAGEVLEVKGDDVLVAIGNFRLKTDIRNVDKISNKEARESERKTKSQWTKNYDIKDVSTTLDVRGLMGDEAVQKVDRFLDDSVSAGVKQVEVIHGHGTGALRKRIAAFLKGDPRIKASRFGGEFEGGRGATIVEL
jgi:DNA mismatch repair protein MutS2